MPSRLASLFFLLLFLLLPACNAPVGATALDPGATGAAVFSGAGAMEHVTHLSETIGSRPAGAPSTATAATYIADRLTAFGYQVQRQDFTFPAFEDRVSELVAGEEPLPAAAMIYSASGDVSGPLVFAGFGRAEDFPGRIDGAVALIERGAQVTFRDKVAAARGAGAVAVVLFNSTESEFTGSLQVPSEIPAVAVSGASGQRLRQRLAGGPLTARVQVEAGVTQRPAQNVVARLPGAPGGEANGAAPGAGGPGGAGTVVVGAHFDSVPAGPGANDNASGTGLLLELARVVAANPDAAPGLDVVFVAFDAEEIGLLGSAHYVASLPAASRQGVRAMLNFDMVGVGDSLRIGGDATLTSLAEDAAREQGATLGRISNSLSGASDHASFIAAGIPGLFFYVSDDPNYHTAGDVPAHVSPARLQQVGDLGAGVLKRLAAT
jgi:aminopeptidase YwaD